MSCQQCLSLDERKELSQLRGSDLLSALLRTVVYSLAALFLLKGLVDLLIPFEWKAIWIIGRLCVAGFGLAFTFVSFKMLQELWQRNIKGSEVTIGWTVGRLHVHKPGVITTDDREVLDVWSPVRLGGKGHYARAYSLYLRNILLPWSIQFYGPDFRCHLVDQVGRTIDFGTCSGNLAAILDLEHVNVTSLAVFKTATVTGAANRSDREELGIHLAAIEQRFEALPSSAGRSAHAHITRELCQAGLSGSRSASVRDWYQAATRRWPHLFVEQPKSTILTLAGISPAHGEKATN